jgi:AAA domain
MPSFDMHTSHNSTKMLIIGNPGAGKTGSTVSLIKAGYNLRYLDFDNGLDIIGNILKKEPNAAELLKNVYYETCADKLTAQGGKLLPVGMPTAFSGAMDLLTHWKKKERTVGGVLLPAYDLGKVSSWGPKDVLVIDSLTHMSNAAMRYVLAINGKSGEQPSQPNWGQAMALVEDTLALLYSTEISCNVIMLAHVAFEGAGEEGATSIGYPNTLGRKLPPKVGSYFNTVILAKSTGTGTNTRHQLITKSESDARGVIELKTSDPHNIPHKLPIESGLADIFKILHGGK